MIHNQGRPLGELAAYINGRAFKPDEWVSNGLPIIRIQNLTQASAPFNYYAGEVDDRHRVSDGDLLVSWSASLGAFIWRRGEAVLNQHIFKVLERAAFVDRTYLYFAIREAMSEIRAQVHGATMRHITKPEFEAVRVPVPKLDEQRRIASRLTEQLSAVERARRAAEERVEAAWELEGSLLRAVFLSREATSWPQKPLGELTRLVSGGTPPRGEPALFRGGIPWVKTLDLNGREVVDTEEKITEGAFETIRGELLPVGTLMVAMYGGKGTIGKSGILAIEACTNQAVCSILPSKSKFVGRFLLYWLNRIRSHWMKFSGGNRRDPNINKAIVARMPAPAPPIAVQLEAVRYLDAGLALVAATRASAKAELSAIEALPAALLREAFEDGA